MGCFYLWTRISVPLWDDGEGGLRVGSSRVQFDRIISARAQGATPEDIVEMYSSLALADVYMVIGWMLRHPADVEAYRCRRDQQAEALRQQLVDSGSARCMTRTELEAIKERRNAPAAG